MKTQEARERVKPALKQNQRVSAPLAAE